MIWRTHAILALSLVVVGCGGSGGGGGDAGTGDSAVSASLAGVGQKGPFQNGATVMATELGADGLGTGNTVTAQVSAAGDFSLPTLGWSGGTEVAVSGRFFNEYTASFSSGTRSLEAIVNASGVMDANVNLYTHLLAARVRALMGGGETLAGARETGLAELQALVGIDSAPEGLDLADSGEASDESDSANLLEFSAAALATGLDQGQFNAIADDFADDGRVNGSATSGGDGRTYWEQVQMAPENHPNLLIDARTNIEDQYGTDGPNYSGAVGRADWRLSACDAAKLDEPRVFCLDETFNGTKGDDEGAPILFYPPEDGFYAFTLTDPAGKLSGGGWRVFLGQSLSGTDMGDSFNDGTAPYEDVTALDLDAHQAYALQAVLNGLDSPGDSFQLSATQISEGAAYYPVPIEVGEAHSGRVGEFYDSGTNAGGPATSWYRLEGGVGRHTIRVSNYPSPTSGGGLQIRVFSADGDLDAIYDLSAVPETGKADPDGTTATELTLDLAADKTHFILVTNQFRDFHRTSLRPEAGWVEYDLQVTLAD